MCHCTRTFALLDSSARCGGQRACRGEVGGGEAEWLTMSMRFPSPVEVRRSGAEAGESTSRRGSRRPSGCWMGEGVPHTLPAVRSLAAVPVRP